MTADDSVDAEVGVEELGAFGIETLGTELSIESPSRGLCWRSEAGAADVGGS